MDSDVNNSCPSYGVYVYMQSSQSFLFTIHPQTKSKINVPLLPPPSFLITVIANQTTNGCKLILTSFKTRMSNLTLKSKQTPGKNQSPYLTYNKDFTLSICFHCADNELYVITLNRCHGKFRKDFLKQ